MTGFCVRRSLFAAVAMGSALVEPAPAALARGASVARAQVAPEREPLSKDVKARAEECGLNVPALERLVARGRESNSDALIVVKDGETVGSWTFDRVAGPIEAMSVTKSVVGLAFGRLLADGRLESLEVPVHEIYPEWNQGRKAQVTVRQLLTQTSGLQCVPSAQEIYRSPDFVQFALAAELMEDPGTQFRYNNKAVNLLAGIVQRLSGKRMDVLIGEEIFEILDITGWGWSLDPAGNPHAMAGLQIWPEDLVKIGQLLLDGGEWNGEQVLPADFVEMAVHDAVDPPRTEPEGFDYRPRYGLLWWILDEPELAVTDRLLEEWRRTGAPEEFVTALAAAKGLRGPELITKVVELAGGDDAWNRLTWQSNRPDLDVVSRRYLGFRAEGYLGQHLVVLPEHRLIAVRMRRSPEDPQAQVDPFGEFPQAVLALVKAPSGE